MPLGGKKALEQAGLLVTKEQAKKTGAKPKAPPKNCLRHSFVSYHVALHRDPGRTALLVSHKKPGDSMGALPWRGEEGGCGAVFWDWAFLIISS